MWYGRRDDAQLFTGRNNTVEQTFPEPSGETGKKNVYLVQATYLNGKTIPLRPGVSVQLPKGSVHELFAETEMTVIDVQAGEELTVEGKVTRTE